MRVIVLGQVARAAFAMRQFEPLTWVDWSQHIGRVQTAWCPHPSGLNRWWNDPANEAAARAFLVRAAKNSEQT